MACPRCGSATTPGQKFCAECGLPLSQRCPNCATAFEGSPKFCAECGHALGRSADPATAQRASATERRFVSVLFADLVGFTQLSEQHDAEEVRDLLSRYFEKARQVIEEYGGTVEKFIGDAVMAVWGAPTAHEDDAERAVRAALELVQRVGELSLADSPLGVRAGVLSGEAAVTPGRVGEGMVAGDVVNTASRIQSVAPPGTVLVGEQTRNATSAAIAYEPAGEQVLKGKQAPVPAWRALRVVARVGGEGREEGLEPPFVGRQVEMRLLRDQLHAVETERRLRVVSITGQAGMGKSRLAWELEKYLDGLAGAVYYWHQGRSPSYGEGVTFWALGEMVRRRARIAEGEEEDSTRAKLRATLAEFVQDPDERKRLEPALGALLGIGDVDWDAREQLFSAWRTFFERIAARAPSVLVFEDLQWADSGLLDFIDHLVDWTRDKPILILTLARPEILERRPDFGAGRSAFVALRLEPLSSDAMSELLRGLVPQLPEIDLARIVARAEGVPLYAVETVRSLADGGHLVRNGDVYDLAGPLPPLDVPPTLRALIASRLDALTARDRGLLQDAAVVGLSFAVPALAALAGRATGEVERELRALAGKELVALETDPRSPLRGQYRFRQELVREVAYGTLSRRERRARHLAAARYYEGLGDEELAGVLANHYLEAYRAAPEGVEGAAVAGQARLALRGAAERASRLHSNEQAISYFEQALAVTFDEAEQVQLKVKAGKAAGAAGQVHKAEQYLRAAVGWQQQHGQSVEAAKTSASLANLLLVTSRIDDAVEAIERALAGLPPEASAAAIKLNGELARAHLFRDEGELAMSAATRALDDAERLGLPTHQLLITKSWALAATGKDREATALLLGVMQMADQQDDFAARSRARFNLSSFLLQDDPHLALRLGLEGISLTEQHGEVLAATNMRGNAAGAAAVIGDLEKVMELESGAPELGTSMAVAVRAYAALAYALRGDEATAQERVALLRPLVAQGSSRQDVSGVLFLEASVAFFGGHLQAARRLALEGRVSFNSGVERLQSGLIAARVALLAGEAARLGADLDWIDARSRYGMWLRRCVRSLRAGQAALEGSSDEALAEYRAVIEEWRAADMPLDLGLTLFERAYLLGAVDEEAAAGLHEAHTLLGAKGAEGLIDRLTAGAAAVAGLSQEAGVAAG